LKNPVFFENTIYNPYHINFNRIDPHLHLPPLGGVPHTEVNLCVSCGVNLWWNADIRELLSHTIDEEPGGIHPLSHDTRIFTPGMPGAPQSPPEVRLKKLKDAISRNLATMSFENIRIGDLDVSANHKYGCILSIAHFQIEGSKYWEVVICGCNACGDKDARGHVNDVVTMLRNLKFY
jgi:hypothetical protein